MQILSMVQAQKSGSVTRVTGSQLQVHVIKYIVFF